MHRRNPLVKPSSRQISDWIDDHPRAGWWIALWATLVTLNLAVEWFDRVLQAIP